MKMVFQNTPDTEAPVEMNTWFPELKAFWAAENVTGTIHNIYTLRGAPTVRSSKSLVIRTFGGIRPGLPAGPQLPELVERNQCRAPPLS
jgi:hypothetical protein